MYRFMPAGKLAAVVLLFINRILTLVADVSRADAMETNPGRS